MFGKEIGKRSGVGTAKSIKSLILFKNPEDKMLRNSQSLDDIKVEMLKEEEEGQPVFKTLMIMKFYIRVCMEHVNGNTCVCLCMNHNFKT
jgi:hypothetical protein